MRVSELAKLKNIKSHDMLKFLDDAGIYNKKPQSKLTEEEIQLVEDVMNMSQQKIEPVEINSHDYYDVKSEMLDQYPQAKYFLCLSPRGVGKTTGAILCMIQEYIKTGNPSVLIRRRDVELLNLKEMFSEICAMDFINYWSNGKYNSVYQWGKRSFLCKRDEDGKVIDKDKNFFLFSIALSQSANVKGLQLNRSEENIFVRYILFDELIPINNDFVPSEGNLFFNTVSTIVRNYNKAQVILMGNTVMTAKSEILQIMGIDIADFLPGGSFTLGSKRLYKYEGETEEETNYLAVHYIDKTKYAKVSGRSNNSYYNFNNRKLSQISGISDGEYGIWELNKSFSALPRTYTKEDIKMKFFWISGDEIFEGDVIQKDDCRFIFNHKTGHKIGDGWLDEDHEIIFSTIYDPRRNWIKKINSGITKKRILKILDIIKTGNCYFQNAWLSNYFEQLIKEM